MVKPKDKPGTSDNENVSEGGHTIKDFVSPGGELLRSPTGKHFIPGGTVSVSEQPTKDKKDDDGKVQK